jgi:hypothetical protein
MKNAVFWDVTLCGSCKSRSVGGTYRFHQQGEKNRRAGNNMGSDWQPKQTAKKESLVTPNVPSSSILVTLMMEAIRSSERSVLTRATRSNASEGAIPRVKKLHLGEVRFESWPGNQVS